MNEDVIIQTVQQVIKQSMLKNKMSLELAKALIERVEQKAKTLGMRVVIAISDGAARPVAIHCMDGAYIGSFDVALNKSFTAVAFQMSTTELASLSQPGASLYGVQNTNEGKIVILGGGELLKIGDDIIGAIGVSGGTAKADTELARYGKEICQEVVACL